MNCSGASHAAGQTDLAPEPLHGRKRGQIVRAHQALARDRPAGVAGPQALPFMAAVTRTSSSLRRLAVVKVDASVPSSEFDPSHHPPPRLAYVPPNLFAVESRQAAKKSPSDVDPLNQETLRVIEQVQDEQGFLRHPVREGRVWRGLSVTILKFVLATVAGRRITD